MMLCNDIQSTEHDVSVSQHHNCASQAQNKKSKPHSHTDSRGRATVFPRNILASYTVSTRTIPDEAICADHHGRQKIF